MSSLDQKKMLNRFIACIGANSSLDKDGFYFLYDKFWGSGECTGLMATTTLGFNDIARTLIHYGANINVRNKHGRTSLHYAAWVGNTNMVGILLGLGANVNGVDNFGNTPLHLAAYVSTVRLLLEKGADITIRRTDGSTALGLASSYGRTDVVAFLQSWGR